MQGGALCFITWRVGDSLPQELLNGLDHEIDAYLAREGIRSRDSIVDDLLMKDLAARSRVHWNLFLIRDRYLDQGAGRCPLRKSSHATIVHDSLRRFDEVRYFLTDLVIMPNHIHFIVAFDDEDKMLKQCSEWKRFTGRKINASEGREGEFWQVDQFDHLVRSEDWFYYFRRYIEENPKKSGLKDAEFLHWKRVLQAGA